MTRLAWITPGYPPDRGGVSDHSFQMVQALRAQGHEVRVYSNPHESGFGPLDAELVAYEPEAVVVAYVPLGFAPRTGGISLAFTYWSTQLRRRLGAQTLVLAHEVSLPTAHYWAQRNLKLAALSVAQIAQFEILVRSFDCVVFSNEGTRDAWLKRAHTRSARLLTIRICSNIPVVESADPQADLVAAGYSVAARTVLFFGTGHDSVLFDYLEAALSKLSKVDAAAVLVIVGIDPVALRRLRPSLSDFGSRVQALGFVAAREVSLWLQVADLVLAPLVEGVNARKGTVAAALQHGRAVVTTRGIHTRSDIPWDRICALAPLDPAAFAALAVRYFQDPDLRASVGTAAQSDYETHASATVTAAQLLANVLGQRSRG